MYAECFLKISLVTYFFRHFIPDCVNCPVDTYLLYVSKLHDGIPYLWQRPRPGPVNYVDERWYQCSRMGHNPIETFMKKLSEEANLESSYTNHSIRATCISKLDTHGFEARHITAISSHKSESTIREYSVKCPENKRKQMFDALAQNFQTIKKPKVEPASTVTNIRSDNALLPLHDSTNTSNQNNANNDTLPDADNMQLLNFDPLNDKDLYDFVTQTEKALQNLEQNNTTPPPPPPQQQIAQYNPETHNTSSVVTVTNNTNKPSSMPVIPRMYFPNSTVTINYNISNN